jgi:hypothetical protein
LRERWLLFAAFAESKIGNLTGSGQVALSASLSAPYNSPSIAGTSQNSTISRGDQPDILLGSSLNNMNRIVALILLGVGTGIAALATATPEIDPASGASAVALLAGTLVVIRGFRRK